MKLHYDRMRLVEICEKFGVEELRIFGSFASGQSTEDSDIDILYRFKDVRSLGWTFFDFCDELEKLFGCKVDLVPLENVPDRYQQLMITPSVELYHAT